MLVFLEGLVMCFILLIICVIGIANGPVGLVNFYEPDVQQRVVELGLTTKARIKRNNMISAIALFLPCFTLVPFMVYYINGANNFLSGFLQMSAILWIMGVFDRIFVDWYWVGKTKAWQIKGTEDLKPYIPVKMLIIKWSFTLIGFPVIAAVIAGLMTYIIV
jgi:hypothetical protein